MRLRRSRSAESVPAGGGGGGGDCCISCDECTNAPKAPLSSLVRAGVEPDEKARDVSVVSHCEGSTSRGATVDGGEWSESSTLGVLAVCASLLVLWRCESASPACMCDVSQVEVRPGGLESQSRRVVSCKVGQVMEAS